MRYSFWGIALVLFGLLLLLDNFDVLSFDYVLSTYWPLLIILWGVAVLMRRKKTLPPNASDSTSNWQTQHGSQNTVVSEWINESSFAGNVFLVVTSQTFKGGSTSTTFGNTDIDLSKCTIADGDYILRVHGVFGNTRIILPKDAPVLITGNCTAGKIEIMGLRKEGISPTLEYLSPQYATSTSRLQIHCSKVFGDLVIT